MAEQPTTADIMAAMTDSGFLMEQRIASHFEASGFHVDTNYAFEDPEEKKSREMDVRAIKRVALNEEARLSAFIEFIIECKNSTNPFVFVKRLKNAADRLAPPSAFSYPIDYQMRRQLDKDRYTTKRVDAFFHLGYDNVHGEHLQDSKAVQFCRIDRKGASWHANHGGLYDAMFYPMAKAFSARRAELPKRSNGKEGWNYIWMLVPLVITSGDIFSVDSSLSEPHPEAECSVLFRRELKAGSLKGVYDLTFVTEDGLNDYLKEYSEPLELHSHELVMNRATYVLNPAVDWID